MKLPYLLHKKKTLLLSAGIAVVIASIVYGGYRYLELRKEKIALEGNVAELEKEVGGLEGSLLSVRADLENAKNENSSLTQSLSVEQNKNSAFEAQIKDISNTVGMLRKLSETDPELLKKYSRVYFLSENYVPAQLSGIDHQYLYDQKKPQLILSGVSPYIDGMLAAANRDGIKLRVVSAFRSFYEQASLKLSYKVTYGTGANKFSADQGYSEHQLGTAVDLTTPEIGDAFVKFDGSAAYKWLGDNAYKYGFTLSYPKGNLYYQYEPWHWRFVGVALATKLHNSGEYFYNLSQREIDEFLISFFD